ncbi:MAG: CBS domain-containing protein [Thermoleophilia bacterium]|nr:CBS domain-containing protein [Thermoleophilia bacterium]
MHMTVARLLEYKGDAVWTIAPQASVHDALRLMADKEVGALVVVDGPRTVGLMSERDYARKVFLLKRASDQTRVDEIMTDVKCTVGRDQTTTECMRLMTEHRVRHLPVIEDGELVGLISIGDVVRAVIDEQEFFIKQLQNYIHS